MTLRRRLLLTSAPLALALGLLGLLAVHAVTDVGGTTQTILADNYRSVLAVQRMKEALERTDSATLFAVVGEADRAREQLAASRPAFDVELRVEEQNVTESGEGEAAAELRAHWEDYVAHVEPCISGASPADVRACYFRELEPRFVATKQTADRILALNQDAMVRKSELAQRASRRASAVMLGAAVAALVVGAAATGWLTTRTLRPLSVLGQAVEQFGSGDFAVRANVRGSDEIAQLAHTFNAMAERIAEYRRSSLGELVQAQLAAQAAIDALPDPVLVLGPGGEVGSANRAAEALFGGREGEPLRLGGTDAKLRSAIEAARIHVLQGRGSWVSRGFEEAVSLVHDGSERSFLVHAEPVQEERGIVAVAVVLHDVTRLRRFDELRDDLVSTAAHQLRTPLTSLRMAIHLCLEQVAGPLTPKQQDLLFAAREECERLQETVDELLDLARLQAGRLELHLEPIAAGRLIDEAVRAERAFADAKRVAIEADTLLASDEVRADPERIQLVFANLLENAIRYTPTGGSVSVSARAEGKVVRFEVKDQGPGIPAEHRDRVFEKFVRLPGVESGGAGLGLSIARDIVHAHAGEIGVESGPEGGSAFWFTLPRSGAEPV